ncbi:histone-binding protein RBBP4 [Enteropsectra breve]|nr:histone-binding protein RBBP4 [Enteropsectra breve]KAI5151884.1 histone-binding protein RBBP4 [Enteropsectra breve]
MDSHNELILEEYKIWRKNVPYLYDLVYTQSLKWSSPSVQWFPDAVRNADDTTTQRLLMTTFTGNSEKEHILIAQVNFPDTIDEEGINNADIKFKITQSIPLPVDANKIKYSPLATNLLACKTETDEILIYDYTTHPSNNSISGPDTVLKGHKDGGFALQWNPHKFTELISGGRDRLINIFDINSGLLHSLKTHRDVVNDLAYSQSDPNKFVSVSDDRSIALHDLRTLTSPVVVEKAHKASIEACSYSPFKAELLATSSGDCSVKVWDTRNMRDPLYTLRGHSDDAIAVKWSPHYESLLASSSKDRRVIIWDLNKSSAIKENASPELLFIHGGHTDIVDDFDWNPAEPMEIASVSSNGLLHIWKIPLEEYI